MTERRGSDDGDETHEARQTRGREREVEEEENSCGKPAAAREREEEREAQWDGGAGRDGTPQRPDGAISGDRQSDREAHRHHERKDVPVPQRTRETRVLVSVSHDVGERLAQERVHGDRDRDREEAVSGDAQLRAAHRDETGHRRYRQVEGRQVEGHPAQVGTERPQHREPDPGDEQTERGQSTQVQQRGPRPATQEPHPHGRDEQISDGDGRAATDDVAAGKEGEDGHGRHGDGERQDIACASSPAPIVSPVFSPIVHLPQYTWLVTGSPGDEGER